MPAKNVELTAVQQIVTALQPLDSASQDRVLASALALLGKTVPRGQESRSRNDEDDRGSQAGSQRPKGLTELLSEKNPGTNSQRIALFAYYRDKFENKSRFGRGDLEAYFGTARLDPPGNYDRDFSTAAEKGWIHESGDQSYITTSGIEVVERGFEGERAYARKGSKKGLSKSARSSTLARRGRVARRK
jgi:hypothetical protein